MTDENQTLFGVRSVPMLKLSDQTWIQVRDGNITALVLFHRHYSKYHYKDGRITKRFVGPGERIVLITQDGLSLFVWRKFINDSGQKGVNCSIFRNEGPELSSELILKAEHWAFERWPGERLYTYVDPNQVQSSNPGYCFKVAGWNACGITKMNKLLILEKYPSPPK